MAELVQALLSKLYSRLTVSNEFISLEWFKILLNRYFIHFQKNTRTVSESHTNY